MLPALVAAEYRDHSYRINHVDGADLADVFIMTVSPTGRAVLYAFGLPVANNRCPKRADGLAKRIERWIDRNINTQWGN
jgi:hypothetical protein